MPEVKSVLKVKEIKTCRKETCSFTARSITAK